MFDVFLGQGDYVVFNIGHAELKPLEPSKERQSLGLQLRNHVSLGLLEIYSLKSCSETRVRREYQTKEMIQPILEE